MTRFKPLLLPLLLPGVVTLSVLPTSGAEGVISKVQLPGTNYCHLKFPAVRRNSLNSGRPVLSDPSSGDIVSYYGPCDYNPLGSEQIRAQRDDRRRERMREWGDN